MIMMRRGMVLAVTGSRPGAVELTVEVDGAEAPALAYPALTGDIGPGDRVLVNVTAVALGLGTGGWHLVMAVEAGSEVGSRSDGPSDARSDIVDAGHLMKLRYTPEQMAVLGVEEDASPHHATMAAASSLGHAPVVWLPLHSMLGPAVAGALAAGAGSVVYVMTDGAALPAAFSRLTHRLTESGMLAGVVTCGQAFGGDLEAVNAFSGLLAARHVLGADVVVIGDGPGNTGTRTTWGASNVASAMSLNVAAILEAEPVAALRVSFADRRPEHRVVSHHSITALSRVAMAPVHVAVPTLPDDQARQIWDRLREAKLEERHRLVEVTGDPALDMLAAGGIVPDSMGRTLTDDPAFFLAAGAAGVLAGRMAALGRAWRSG